MTLQGKAFQGVTHAVVDARLVCREDYQLLEEHEAIRFEPVLADSFFVPQIWSEC